MHLMINDKNDLPDVDDVPPSSEASLGDALERMTEDDWLLLKNDLQEYLHRIEKTENPAYDNADMLAWIDEYGARFDRFYQHLRNTKPELLLCFHVRAFDDNEQNDAEFVREWVAFRDKQEPAS